MNIIKMLKLLRLFFIYFVPIALIMLVIIPVYGVVNKWDSGERILSKQYPGCMAITIGVGSQYHNSQGLSQKSITRNYLVFNAGRNPSVVTVSEFARNDEVKINTTESSFQAILYVVFLFILMIFSVKVSVPVIVCRKIKEGEKGSEYQSERK